MNLLNDENIVCKYGYPYRKKYRPSLYSGTDGRKMGDSSEYQIELFMDQKSYHLGQVMFFTAAVEYFGGPISYDEIVEKGQPDKRDNVQLEYYLLYFPNARGTLKMDDFISKYRLVRKARKKSYYTFYGSSELNFTFDGGMIEVNLPEVEINYQVKPPLSLYKHFVQSKTLTLVCITLDESEYVRTFSKNIKNIPLFPWLSGNVDSNDLNQKIEHSSQWKYTRQWPRIQPDLMMPDAEFECWYSNYNGETRLPKTKYNGRCAACGSKSGITKEHCIPKWFSSANKTDSIIAPIFCSRCNNYFGDNFERPVRDFVVNKKSIGSQKTILFTKIFKSLFKLYNSKDEKYIKRDIFNAWAVKTALTLNIASNGIHDFNVLKSIRENGNYSPYEVIVFPRFNSELNKNFGYIYYISKFSNVEGDPFLMTFFSANLSFVVFRSNANNTFRDVCSYYFNHQNANGQLDVGNFHQFLNDEISGVKTADMFEIMRSIREDIES